MRPYLAVIADSFHAAFSSRVLWVALAAIYLFLFSIAPIGYREVFTTTIRWFDFSNGTRMKAMLAQDIDKEKQTPAGMIARAMPAEIQGNLRKVAEGQEVRIRLDLLADSLNELLDRDDWYDTAIWKNTNPRSELRELDAADASELSDDLRRRRARLRIEAALPGVFENRGARSMALTYAGFDFPAVFQLDPTQFKLILNHFVLRLIIDWVLGFVMIFLGILVTASIIPDMLQPGSLHLLLSKPISRPMLFLAKFLGGCAFVLVCVAQLIVGLWLISGFRLGIWNARLLLCIPVCVFLFAVFFSVSAVSGLRWRSSILSIGLANAFGAICLIIGIIGGVSDTFVKEPDRIESLAVSDGTLIAATRGADLRRFDSKSNRWVDLFPENNGGGDRILGPVKLADGRVVTARVRGGRMNLFGSGATSMLILDAKEGWQPVPSIELPASTSQLFATGQGELVALNTSELMMADKTLLKAIDESASKDAETLADDGTGNVVGQSSGWLPKLLKMMGGETEGFRSLLPRQVSVTSPRGITFSPDGRYLFVSASGRLTKLSRPSDEAPAGPWTVETQTELNVGNEKVWLRTIGEHLVVLQSKAAPRFFDQLLRPRDWVSTSPADFSDINISEVVSCGESGKVAVLTDAGSVYLLTSHEDARFSIAPIALRDVDAATWDDETGFLWLSYAVDSAVRFDVKEGVFVEYVSPSQESWRLVDRYLVTPLRTITPQTGELSETIAALVSGESAMQLPIASETAQAERYNVWRPVLTCAGFIIVMLSVGCVYFTRADF
jgi:hypothetical protein